MLTITCVQMKKMDAYAINEIGIPSIVLMETAALKVLENIDLDKNDSFTIVCGIGNNGGDGLAVAKHLIIKDKKVEIFIVGNLNKGSQDFNINLKILQYLDVRIINIVGEADLNFFINSISKSDLTIDSIFGIGLDRNVEAIYYKVIDIINQNSKSTLSIDIPSGLDGDSGEVLGIAIKADTTVTFHQMKKGLPLNKDYSGNIVVEDIGIPELATRYVLKNK